MHATHKLKLTFVLVLQHALLTVAAGTGSTAFGTAAHTVESPFGDCSWPGFDAALSRFSKAITFTTISSSTTQNHAVYDAEFKALW
jgi:hypothetical protein